MNSGAKPIANPYVMLREEFDDWAILFDPDTGHGFGLSPTGVYVWKCLDGEHSIDEMIEGVRRNVKDVPKEAGEQLFAFIEDLTKHGLAAHDAAQVRNDRGRPSPRPTCVRDKVPDAVKFTYEPPKLVDLRGEGCAARGTCQNGSGDSGFCQDGGSAGSNCFTGSGPTSQCGNGSVAPNSKCCTGTTAAWASDCQNGNCPARCANCTVGGGLCSYGSYAGGGTTCATGSGGTCGSGSGG